MSITVPLYGGSGSGTGGKLTVTAPAGVMVTVSKDGKTKTRVASADGVAVFQGLASGEWTVTITDGTQTATKTVAVTADYSMNMTFFSATINVTYPEGSVCTATDGVTTLTAPDTSGTWSCDVSNAGTWTISCTDGNFTDSADVFIAEDGQIASVNLAYKFFIYNNGSIGTPITSYGSSSDNGESLYINGNGVESIINHYATTYRFGKSGYKTLKATVFANSGCKAVLGTASIPNVEYFDQLTSYYQTSYGEVGTLTLDVSNIADDYHVLICAYGSGAISVSQIWLEH